TRLLLDERDGDGRIDLGRFWIRRVRRLLPASSACIAAIVGAHALGAFPRVTDLRADVLGALLQVANWVQLAGDVPYAEQVAGARNPLEHFWSLSIEEQFYWCWPLVVVAISRRRRPDRWIHGATLASLAAAPAIASTFGAEAAYWATPARAAEILVGASAAVLVRRRSGDTPGWIGPAGVVGLAVVLAAAVTWPADGGPAASGWLAGLAVASAAVVVAADGVPWFARPWTARPLVAVGTISYGVYLYHWPVFLIVRDEVGRSTPSFGLAVAVTLAVATVSYRFLESPIRRGTVRPPVDPVVAIGVTAALVVVALVAPLSRPDPFADPRNAAGQLDVTGAGSATAPTTSVVTPPLAPSTTAATTATVSSKTTTTDAPSTTTTVTSVGPIGDRSEPPPAPPAPIRLLVAGDSVTWSLGNGLVDWADRHPRHVAVGQVVSISCGFLRGASIPAFDDRYQDDCDDMLDRRVPTAIAATSPHIVVLGSTRADVQPHRWPGESSARPIDDPVFVRRLVEAYVSTTDRLLADGVGHVAWLLPPTVRSDGSI
ncbi:MAG: acyltransferase family protein, partial [Acidimicrobiia bacterium]